MVYVSRQVKDGKVLVAGTQKKKKLSKLKKVNRCEQRRAELLWW
jgi:hypothetical protein